MEKGNMEGFTFTCALLLGLLLVGTRRVASDITCTEAITSLSPCLPFLLGTTPSPVPTCCLAVQNVNDAASTKAIRQNLCNCFKQAAPALGVNRDYAKKLPDLCGVSVPVPIDPSVDCSKIGF